MLSSQSHKQISRSNETSHPGDVSATAEVEHVTIVYSGKFNKHDVCAICLAECYARDELREKQCPKREKGLLLTNEYQVRCCVLSGKMCSAQRGASRMVIGSCSRSQPYGLFGTEHLELGTAVGCKRVPRGICVLTRVQVDRQLLSHAAIKASVGRGEMQTFTWQHICKINKCTVAYIP